MWDAMIRVANAKLNLGINSELDDLSLYVNLDYNLIKPFGKPENIGLKF